MENEQNMINKEKCDCGQCAQCRGFFGTKTNGIFLLILIVLMVIAIVIMLGDKEKYFPVREDVIEEVVQDDVQVKDMYTHTAHGFSIQLPKGFNAYEENPSGGPVTIISIPVGGFEYITNAQTYFDTVVKKIYVYVEDVTLGATTFQKYKEGEFDIYWFRQGGVAYKFTLPRNTDTATKNSFLNLLKTFKFVGWPSVAETFSTEKFSFQAPSNWNESSVVQRGCPWFSVGAPNNGMVIKGEVGIYPVSCFDLSKQPKSGSEVFQKNGYYIIYYFDDSMSAEELKSSRAVFETIKQTFKLK